MNVPCERKRARRAGETGALALFLVLWGAACAERAAGNATAGAIQGLKAQASANPEEQVSRIIAQRAVAGALDTLESPEQRERIRQIVAETVNEAVASAFHSATSAPAATGQGAGAGGRSPAEVLAGQLARAAAEDAIRKLTADLGNEGPLTTTLAQTSERMSAAAVSGAREELFPGCFGPDAETCRQRRLEDLARATGAGLSTGVRDSLGWPLLIFAGALGVAAGVFVHWVWSLRVRRRELRAA
jgi:hypothetical protein